MTAVAKELPQVKLPVFCHSVIDDLPMSLEAFRVYSHLARKWGNGKTGALGSYADMAEHCFRSSYPKATRATLRRKAIAAVAELEELNLLHKKTREGEDKRCLANAYILHDISVVVSTHQGECQYTRVVSIHRGSAIAPQEDTNNEVTTSEDTLPLNPLTGEESECEEKPELEETGTHTQPPASLPDKTKPLDQRTETVEDKSSAAAPNITENSSTPPPSDPFFKRRRKPNENYQGPPPLEKWEIVPGEPYPYFWQWRANQYKQEGGKWAANAKSNAYSEFYNNRDRARVLWLEFLEYYNITVDSALAIQSAGMTPTLPSCFSNAEEVTEEKVAAKVQALGSNVLVALPQATATPSCNQSTAWLQPETMQPARHLNPAIAQNKAPEGAEDYDAYTVKAQEHIALEAANQNYEQICRMVGEKMSMRSYARPPQLEQEMTRRRGDAGTRGVSEAQCASQDKASIEQSLSAMSPRHHVTASPRPLQQPISSIERYRGWLQSSEPALVKEARKWAQKNALKLDIVYDEQGIIIDFEEGF